MLLEFWQVWCHDHFSGESVLVINHSLSEELFPYVQSEIPPMQFHSISSCPVVGHQREMNTFPSTALEEVSDCDKVPPSSFSSPTWTNQVTSAAPLKFYPWDLSPSWSPSSGHTDSLISFLYSGAHNCKQYSRWDCTSAEKYGIITIIWQFCAICTPGHSWPSQMPGHTWVIFNLPSFQMARSFHRAVLLPLIPQFVCITGITLSQVQNLALVNFHMVGHCPVL